MAWKSYAVAVVLTLIVGLSFGYAAGREGAPHNYKPPMPPSNVQTALVTGHDCWLEVKYTFDAATGNIYNNDSEWLCK